MKNDAPIDRTYLRATANDAISLYRYYVEEVGIASERAQELAVLTLDYGPVVMDEAVDDHH